MSKYLTMTAPNGELVRLVKAAVVAWGADPENPKLTRVEMLNGFHKIQEPAVFFTREYDASVDD
jgi:hypothetical protein